MTQDIVQEKEKHLLEVMLIIVCAGLTCLLYVMQGYKMVILNLFFLPVVLGGFFLGRYRAGVLALFCVVAASLVTAVSLASFTAAASPLVMALAVTVWAAVLGLTALLVGSLSDDRIGKLKELHEAYVGVVEVLSQYLQSAHPHLKARSVRVAELSQAVAAALKLSPRQIDDIRVAALLYDMGNIEVTTKVIRRAVGTMEDETQNSHEGTFQGMDLMLSLGSVLSGAVPLLINQGESLPEPSVLDQMDSSGEVPVGAKIIRAARAYCELVQSSSGGPRLSVNEIFDELRSDTAADYDTDVLAVLQLAVSDAEPAPGESVEGVPAGEHEAAALSL